MKLALTNEQGDFTNIEVEPSTELGMVQTLAEAEFNIPVQDQVLLHNGQAMRPSPDATLASTGIHSDDILLVMRKPNSSSAAPAVSSAGGNRTSTTAAGQTPVSPVVESQIEQLRQAILSDANLRMQLSAQSPGLVEAAQNDPTRFRQMAMSLLQEQAEARRRMEQQMALLEADPFDVEAQRKIEEMIQQQNIQRNMETAIEFNPEVFGRVHMLYINCQVNGYPIKAFVDSGAQMTVISPKCAEVCGIMRLCDKRFAGVARGVGTSKIHGRVHSAPFKLGNHADNSKNLFLECSFTVTEFQDSGMELLIGLDMLKRFQACIDLAKNVLRIGEFETPFLPENELPPHARMDAEPPTSPKTASAPIQAGGSSQSKPATASQNQKSATTGATSSAPAQQPAFSQAHIDNLMALGASREQALAALKAAGGNVELAAGMLFTD